MKFKCSVIVNRPRDLVVKIFSDPSKLVHFQGGFLRKTLISGESGKNGAVSKMYYKQGKGEMEITETIVSNNLPDTFFASYYHMHVENTMHCTFTSISENETRYDSEIEYTVFRSYVIRAIAWLYPSFFKKQVQKWMDNFKAYVEKQ